MSSPTEVYQKRLKSGELNPDKVQKEAIEVLQGLFDAIVAAHKAPPENFFERLTGLVKSKDESPKGVYMHGGVGRGKSMLMDLFYGCLPDDIRKERVHFHEFMIEVHNYLHERRSEYDVTEGVDEALPSLASRISERSRVLCFDEFHVTDVADAMILGRLFTALFDRDVLVVATSNWPPDDLYKGGLQRERFLPFIELLKNRLNIVHLDSPIDYRAQFLRSEGSYFWPLGEHTQRRIDELFEKLTDCAAPDEAEITVKGRVIAVEAQAKGVARFSFAQLCENPHGAEDYIAIAKTYGTIFLEGIPKLGYDRRNEAKRLMTLIDALYENQNRLIVTADAAPDRLYFGHDHAFEFERTISRLMEMQSTEWLEKAA